jgi:hypothetical protein
MSTQPNARNSLSSNKKNKFNKVSEDSINQHYTFKKINNNSKLNSSLIRMANKTTTTPSAIKRGKLNNKNLLYLFNMKI